MRSIRKPSGIIAAVFAMALIAPVKHYASEIPEYSSAYVLPGTYVSYATRIGYRKLDDAYVRLDMDGLPTLGVTFGKRFALNPKWRIQAALEGGWGAAEDGELYYWQNDGEGIGFFWYDFRQYYTGGVLADLHLLFPSGTRAFFLSAGTGFHLTCLWGALRTTTPAASFNIGAGMDCRIFKKNGMSAGYNLRLWQPASYIYSGEAFPRGVTQKEFHITHMLQAQLLLPERGK